MSRTPDSGSRTRRPRSSWVVVAVLATAGVATSLQQTMLLPLLPEFSAAFGVSPAETSWLVTATLLTAAIGTPLLGRLADLRGKRPVLIVCVGALALGSAICTVGPTLEVVVAGRAIIGVGMAVTPIGISVLRDELDPERLPAGLAVLNASFGIGSGVGFPLGGLLAAAISWRAMFALSAVLSVLLIVAILVVLRRGGPRATTGTFDVLGALLLSFALVALLLGITGAGPAASTAGFAACIAAFAVAFATWIVWEARVRSPIVDLRVARRLPVVLTNLATALVSLAIFANVMVTAVQVQAPAGTPGGFGLDGAGAGLLMVPSAIAFFLVAPLCAVLLRRLGARWVLVLGCATMAVPFALRAVFHQEPWMAVLFSTVIAVGTALSLAATPLLLFGNVPTDQTASAMGVNALIRSVGTAVSAASAGMLLASATAPRPFGTTYDLLFVLAAAACAVGGLLAIAIPVRRPGAALGS